MKSIIQYVTNASVTVDKKIVGQISQGYLVLIGICQNDTPITASAMAKKIASLRIIPDENGKINKNLEQVHGQILLVSQFTLCADTSGNRPSFSNAATKDKAIQLLSQLQSELESTFHLPVQTGLFGAHMDVALTNHGPITITLDL